MIFMYRNYDSTRIQIVNRMFLIHWAYNGTSLWGKEIKEGSGKIRTLFFVGMAGICFTAGS